MNNARRGFRAGALVVAVVILSVSCALPHRWAARDRGSVPCALADRGDVQALRQALESVASLPSAWAEYRLQPHPVLLIVRDTASSAKPASAACAILWRAGQPIETALLPTEPRYQTPLYSIYSADSAGPEAVADFLPIARRLREVPEQLRQFLARAGVRRVVIIPIPGDLDKLGAMAKALEAAPNGLRNLRTYLAVHESFHLHSQFPAWLGLRGRYQWPRWDRQPDRAALRRECYPADADSTALREEYDTLLAAFSRAWLGEPSARRTTTDEVRALTRRYVQLRDEREARLASRRVARGNETITCAEAEDVMELEEGTAQWIAHTMLVRAHLQTVDEVSKSYQRPQPERFYQTGAMMMWLLEYFYGPERLRREVTPRMATAPDRAGAVFAQLKVAVH